MISVTDTGIGIAEADIERAFEPFTQLDSTLARRFEGAGIGLYMSRALAEGHGGRLRLHSRPGEGTTAELRLPASRLIWPDRGPSCRTGGTLMTPLAVTDRLFFERADAQLDRDAAERHLGAALAASDDGELFLEYRESEQISLDDGRIRSAGFDTTLGFGLRAVSGEATGYAHAGELSDAALGAPQQAWPRSRQAIPALRPSRRARPIPGCIPMPIRCPAWTSPCARRSWGRSTSMRAARTRA